jgi:hypothetical protein
VLGAEEEKNSNCSDSELALEPRSINKGGLNESSTSFNKEAATYDELVGDCERAQIEIEQHKREDPFNAYKEKEHKPSEKEQDNNNVTMLHPQPPATVKMIIAGMKLQIRSVPAATNATAWALFRMENRLTYPAEKLSALFKAIGKAQKNKFGLLTLALEDQDKLEDTYALQMLLESTKDHCVQYGVSNIFTVLIYDDANKHNITEQINILENHSTATLQQLADSVFHPRL